MSQLKHKPAILAPVRRVVVKLGSSVVTTASSINGQRIAAIAAEIARMVDHGYQVVLVSSGARAAGLSRLGMSAMPVAIPEQQAAAAVGQISLMSHYERCFSDCGHHVGQVLLSVGDLHDRSRYLNARHTMEHLLAHGIIPVVNENDSVAVEELKFGDNDHLSALVAGLVSAELLVILTDVDGVYDGPPTLASSSVVDLIENIDQYVLEFDGPAGARKLPSGELGSGGMASKLRAAASAAHRGITTVIADGTTEGSLTQVLQADSCTGTLVLASASPISHRKHWIAYGMATAGTLQVDKGALAALSERGSSLLPSGVTSVAGSFAAGDCVTCLGPDGKEFARGLVAYDSDDCERIKGSHSSSIEASLGYHSGDELIHRDNLVLLEELTQENQSGD